MKIVDVAEHYSEGGGVLSKANRKYAIETEGIRLDGFTKDREELAQAYASSDVLIHGSAAETFGLGVAEAICSGLPVVAPLVGGAADLVGNSNGLMYSPGNADECAKAVRKILEKDRDDWQANLLKSSQKIN